MTRLSILTRQARDLYDWASRLTAESAGESLAEYYWTPQVERVIGKLTLSKRALVGVVGVQGAGKSAAMRAVADRIARVEGFGSECVVAVKITQSGGLMDSFRLAFGEAYRDRVEQYLKQEAELQTLKRLRRMHQGKDAAAPSALSVRSLPRRIIRERETQALEDLIYAQHVILIDMPDYPKHDRRLIVRDLDEIQGLWNRLMAGGGMDVSFVIFIQKETYNHADHFFYGKMDLVDLMPLTVAQLLKAYDRKWSGYAPFTEETLQYIAKMSRGIFRRFKRYIALVLEAWITERAGDSDLIDLTFTKECVTKEELTRDLQKELEGIFKNREQSERALRLLMLLSDQKEGISQNDAAETLELNEMAVSRIAKELEEHGYIKRTTRQRRTLVYDRKLDEHVESYYTEKIMELIK